MARSTFNTDALNNAPLKEVARGAFLVIDTLQVARPEVQQAALAAAFLLLSDHRKLDPYSVFAATRNMLASRPASDQEDDHFEAIRNYIKYEIPR